MWTPDQGYGFPSASLELAQREVNYNDPNGYFSDLDLPPYATEREVRRRCKFLLSVFHPDGSSPNPELFRRISMIYAVLRDPVQRSLYEHTPEGHVYVDEQVVQDHRDGLLSSSVFEKKSEQPETWTYFSDSPEPGDKKLAEQWYSLLLRAAYDTGAWAGTIRLHLTTKRVNDVVGEEVYVYKHDPDPDRATAVVRRWLMP